MAKHHSAKIKRPEQQAPECEGQGTFFAPSVPPRYIAYPQAIKLLIDRLGATPEELAAWVYFGPEKGGLAAYTNANELEPPPRFRYQFGTNYGYDYLSPLMSCWFREEDIVNFQAVDRYITWQALVARWSNQPGIQAEAHVRAKITESGLLDIHPITGLTKGFLQEFDSFPLLESALFLVSHVKQIEADEGIDASPLYSSPHSAAVEPGSDAIPPSGNQARSEDSCAIFRRMENLHPREIAISIVGDRSESGLAGNNLLEVAIRGVTRRVALAELDLVNRLNGALNMQGAVLVGLAQKERISRSSDKSAARIKRVRDVFRKHFGISADPFLPHQSSAGWLPLFSIVDLRGLADERAKQKAERRMTSLDEWKDRGRQLAATGEEEDTAGQWLEDNDPTFQA